MERDREPAGERRARLLVHGRARGSRGQQYKYVVRGGAGELWRNDPYAREVIHSNGPSAIVDGAYEWGAQSAYGMPPWDELVIYQIHAGTFNDAPGGGPGTFDTMIPKLDYLSETLCVNAVQLLPAAEFPGGSSLGYNPSHIFAIEREYGGPAAFQRFIRAAHEHGVAVILDVVYNHLGPHDLDLKRFDGWWDPDHPDGIYFYDGERLSTKWGAPRPDYGRGEVRQFLRDNALYWLEALRVDGLRVDGTNYMRTIDNDWRDLPDGWSLMRWINDEIHWRFPWKLTIAEDMQGNPWITAKSGQGGAGFDAQWDARFVHPVRETLAAMWDQERDLGRLENAAIPEAFPRGFTTADLLHRFGQDRTRDGHLVSDLLEILPQGGRFENVSAMLEDIADRQAAALRTTEAANLAIMSAFGLEAGVEQVAAASVETFKSIPPDARVALSRAGIATLGKLATASPQETARALEAAGLKGYSAGDVAEWTGAAKVLTKVR